jgi:dienelactone hydrolase
LKRLIAVSVIVLTVLTTAAAIVFLSLFVSERSHTRTLHRQLEDLRRKLVLVEAAGPMPELMSPDKVSKRVFISHLDGVPDLIAIAPSVVFTGAKQFTLIVYLHGMGGSFYEPFIFPKDKPLGPALLERDNSLIMLSCSYRNKASWGSDAALADITQNIRELCQQFPIQKIVMMGTSMGGCTAMNYAATAPSDIQEKISGVVSVESSGDLSGLYRESKVLQSALAEAFGGTPEQVPSVYRGKSSINNVSRLPKRVRVCIVSATRDDIIPPHFQKELMRVLQDNGIATSLIEVNTRHQVEDAAIYCQAFDSVR